ncbi:MAG TPA: DinB family protein [bacterium]|nr:DinB family protein [bacterium]
MVTIKDLLLNHLDYTFEKEAWQPPLATAIQGVTSTQAAWKPGPQRHSIWQIVRHVTHWKRATLEAWDGVKPMFRAGASTDYANEVARTDWREASGDEAAWQADVRALHEVSKGVRERIQAMSEDYLQQPFEGEKMPTVLRVLRMATHDIYHAGQIRYLRALQGA